MFKNGLKFSFLQLFKNLKITGLAAIFYIIIYNIIFSIASYRLGHDLTLILILSLLSLPFIFIINGGIEDGKYGNVTVSLLLKSFNIKRVANILITVVITYIAIKIIPQIFVQAFYGMRRPSLTIIFLLYMFIIIIATKFVFTLHCTIYENINIFSGLIRSWELTKGRLELVLGYRVLIGLVMFTIFSFILEIFGLTANIFSLYRSPKAIFSLVALYYILDIHSISYAYINLTSEDKLIKDQNKQGLEEIEKIEE